MAEKSCQVNHAVDDDGLWVHQKFGFSIPRRNGKTEIIYILELWGLKHGLNMLHTAHRISTSPFYKQYVIV